MRWMLAGLLAAGCAMAGQPVRAQQNCACSTSAVVESQPIPYRGIATQPAVVGSLVMEASTPGTVSTIQPKLSGNPAGAAGGRMAEYSYWVANPGPARTYVSYGPVDQFPFRGNPYGSPNDRWSWYNMGGGNNRYLTRYYYPLLP